MTDGDDQYRLLRGGSWYAIPQDYCRSANRFRNTPHNQAQCQRFSGRLSSPLDFVALYPLSLLPSALFSLPFLARSASNFFESS